MDRSERIEQFIEAGVERSFEADPNYIAAIAALIGPGLAEQARSACIAYLYSVLFAPPEPDIREEYLTTGITKAQVKALNLLSPEAKADAQLTPAAISSLFFIAAMGTGGLYCTKEERRGRKKDASARRLILELDAVWEEAMVGNRRGWYAFVRTCTAPLARFGFPETDEAIRKKLEAARRRPISKSARTPKPGNN
jgi:hypothetical protein